MSWLYLDTSIAVHALRGTPAAEAWFDNACNQMGDELISSRILQTELTRVLRRDNRPVVEREVILRQLAMVTVTESLLTMAEAITEHIKTLDAIHLASALALGSDTVVVSHDSNIKRVALVLGLGVLDPLDPAPLTA